MDNIFEVPVYDGRLKEWRVLNINTGTVYAGHDMTEEAAEDSIKDGETRSGKVVKRVTRAQIIFSLKGNNLAQFKMSHTVNELRDAVKWAMHVMRNMRQGTFQGAVEGLRKSLENFDKS